MCDIHTPITDECIVVYKTVRRAGDGESYFSPFARYPMREGPVSEDAVWSGAIDRTFYTHSMIGRVSGFESVLDAVALLATSRLSHKERLLNTAVLRLVLQPMPRRPIMRGTAKTLSSNIPPDHVTYAGPYVAHMKEISKIDLRTALVDLGEEYLVSLLDDMSM